MIVPPSSHLYMYINTYKDERISSDRELNAALAKSSPKCVNRVTEISLFMALRSCYIGLLSSHYVF